MLEDLNTISSIGIIGYDSGEAAAEERKGAAMDLDGGLPDFFVAGVPKAGTSALHGALTDHPQLLMSAVKEPKYFMCDGRPPAPQSGPGDAHSAKEWIWQRERYEALFSGPSDRLRGESTPFYLYDRAAQGRIAEQIPHAKFVVVVRDPIDRAYSNWLHLWSDGLEWIGDFEEACAAEADRIRRGFGPFWHYQRLGFYGQQVDDLLSLFPSSHLLLLRYRELVDAPVQTLDRICAFLGVQVGKIRSVPTENSRGYVSDSVRSRLLARSVRAGARVGAAFPPSLWRWASRPITRALQTGSDTRPPLDVEVRRRLIGQYRADIESLERLTGETFSDWLRDEGRGAFAARVGGRGSHG
jgi:Sulfotransferase family